MTSSLRQFPPAADMKRTLAEYTGFTRAQRNLVANALGGREVCELEVERVVNDAKPGLAEGYRRCASRLNELKKLVLALSEEKEYFSRSSLSMSTETESYSSGSSELGRESSCSTSSEGSESFL